MLDSAAIARLTPHAGSMCLLAEVSFWDARVIRCVARSHRESGNPLAAGGRLGAACGVEYAAQAMAVHGGLADRLKRRPRAGYLISVRALSLYRPYLDDLDGDLVVEAEMLAGEGTRMSYRFSLSCWGAPVLDGRAAVLLEAAS
jgi:predicted hotdog family 3-hydroxylacyl-ACP dehydratase